MGLLGKPTILGNPHIWIRRVMLVYHQNVECALELSKKGGPRADRPVSGVTWEAPIFWPGVE